MVGADPFRSTGEEVPPDDCPLPEYLHVECGCFTTRGYFGGGRIPIARGQKWLCFGHFSRGGGVLSCGFSQNRNSRIWRKLSSSFVKWLATMCYVAVTPEAFVCERHQETFILFSDDTNIFCSGSDLVQPSIIINNELGKLNEWFAVNKLALNLSKNNFMLFTNCRREQNVSISLTILRLTWCTKLSYWE